MTTPILRRGPWLVAPSSTEARFDLHHNGDLVAQLPMDGARVYGQSASGNVEGLRHFQSGDFVCCERHIHLADPVAATLHIRDLIRWRSEGLLEWRRSWWHEEARTLSKLELYTTVVGCAPLGSHLLPANLYDGNVGSDADRLVPRFAYGPANLFEEHKYPMPWVHVETQEKSGKRWGLTLSVEPCAVVDGHRPDQWWSLGLQAPGAEEYPVLLSVSGHLSVNGQDETIYDAQCHVSPYRDAWVDARPRHVYEKQYVLELQSAVSPRQSWRSPLRRVLTEQPALTAPELRWLERKEIEDAIRLKVGYALRRWEEDENCCGMSFWPSRQEFAVLGEIERWVPRAIEFGCAGMNMRLAACLWNWGKLTGQADLMKKGLRATELWLRVSVAACREGRPAPTKYLTRTRQWTSCRSDATGFARPTADTLNELAIFCRQLRSAGEGQAAWEEQLAELLSWYMEPARRREDGVLPLRWDPDGKPMPEPCPATGGVRMVAALAEASGLPGGAHWLGQAEKLMLAYADRFLGSMRSHPRGMALDSRCEDAESGISLLMAANALRAAQVRQGKPKTESAETLKYATQAADWFLTFAYTWNVPLVPGSLLHSLSFASRGMMDVSVQNRHLHVFSGAIELMQLAKSLSETSGNLATLYREQARRMFVPVVQTIARPERRWGMDEDGEQTEQYNHTNYVQHPHDPVCLPRGGIGRWFVPWTTVWVLSMCLDWLELDETGLC